MEIIIEKENQQRLTPFRLMEEMSGLEDSAKVIWKPSSRSSPDFFPPNQFLLVMVKLLPVVGVASASQN